MCVYDDHCATRVYADLCVTVCVYAYLCVTVCVDAYLCVTVCVFMLISV